jgi:uncharacterized protein (UPF0261 family)
MIDLEGKPFYLREATQALFETLRNNLRKDIPIIEMDCEINAPAFAIRCAETLLASMKARP